MRRRQFLLMLCGLALSLVMSGCTVSSAESRPTTTPAPSAPTATSTPEKPIKAGDVRLQPFAKGFDSPVYLTSAPGQADRVYVVEQVGRIMVVGTNGTVRPQPFLDIRDLVVL